MSAQTFFVESLPLRRFLVRQAGKRLVVFALQLVWQLSLQVRLLQVLLVLALPLLAPVVVVQVLALVLVFFPFTHFACCL